MPPELHHLGDVGLMNIILLHPAYPSFLSLRREELVVVTAASGTPVAGVHRTTTLIPSWPCMQRMANVTLGIGPHIVSQET